MTAPRHGHERGQAAVLLIGVLALAVAFVGLAVDGARVLTVRRDLHAVADSAALAGASAIDERAYRESVGRDIRLCTAGRASARHGPRSRARDRRNRAADSGRTRHGVGHR